MKLSIVSTLYQSAQHITELHQRASAVARQLVGDDYEIVLVNDGSTDISLDIATRLVESDDHVVLVDLSRNFGHHKAMMTGLAHASGEIIFLIDSDLEEDPEWLLGFADQMERDRCDVVFGVQEKRRGGYFERWAGECFYALFNAVAGINIPANIVTARLMTRRYVDALLLHEEREVFIAGLWHITGFVQVSQHIVKHSHGKSTYSFRKRLSLLVNAITSFSNAPLVAIFYAGTLISMIAITCIFGLIVLWLLFEKPLSGWTSVMASIWLLGGLIMSSIGVVGVYLSKIFLETKRRPYTLVREVFKRR